MSQKKIDSNEYGPTDVICPNCGEEFTVKAGKTRRCDVVHEPDGCGEWLHADLETGGTCDPVFGGDR